LFNSRISLYNYQTNQESANLEKNRKKKEEIIKEAPLTSVTPSNEFDLFIKVV